MHAQNSGQGLGFTLGYTVIDRKTLTSAATKLVTGFTTVYALLLALGGSASAGVEACELSAMQNAKGWLLCVACYDIPVPGIPASLSSSRF